MKRRKRMEGRNMTGFPERPSRRSGLSYALLCLCLVLVCACLVRSAGSQPPSPEIQAERIAGRQAARSGQFDAARRHFDTAWKQARAQQDRAAEASVLDEVASAFAHNRQARGAILFYEQALALYRKTSDREMEFKTLLL